MPAMDRNRQILYDITYVWNLKNNTNESVYKTETEWQAEKTNLWLPKGKGEGGINIYTLLYIKR